MMKKKIQKGAALLIILLVITIISALALIISRSTIAGIGFTVNISDSIVAEEAAKAGLEFAVSEYKNNGYLEPNYRKDLQSGYSWVIINASQTGDVWTIEAIGHAGQVVKKHTLTQNIISSPPPDVDEDADTAPLALTNDKGNFMCRWSKDFATPTKNCDSPAGWPDGSDLAGSDIAYDSVGNYYITDASHNWLAQVNKDWQFVKKVDGAVGEKVGGISIAADANYVYVTSTNFRYERMIPPPTGEEKEPEYATWLCRWDKDLNISSRKCDLPVRFGWEYGGDAVASDGQYLYITNYRSYQSGLTAKIDPVAWKEVKRTYSGGGAIAVDAKNVYHTKATSFGGSFRAICRLNKSLTSRNCSYAYNTTKFGSYDIASDGVFLFVTGGNTTGASWLQKIRLRSWTQVRTIDDSNAVGSGITALPPVY